MYMSTNFYKQLKNSDAVNGVITLEQECVSLSVRNTSIDPIGTPLIITVNQSAYGTTPSTTATLTVTSIPINEVRLAPFKTITINTPTVDFDMIVEKYQPHPLTGAGQ